MDWEPSHSGMQSIISNDKPRNWQVNIEAQKEYVTLTVHSPNKRTKLNYWCRYQRKRIKADTIPKVQKTLFEDLSASSSSEYTGGRKKKI